MRTCWSCVNFYVIYMISLMFLLILNFHFSFQAKVAKLCFHVYECLILSNLVMEEEKLTKIIVAMYIFENGRHEKNHVQFRMEELKK